jgi:diphthine methyl ester acylhydrolase
MVDTVLPADSLEFCPSSGFHDIFVCGTYKLEDQETRRGQCLVFKFLLDPEEQLSWCAFLQKELPEANFVFVSQQIQSFDLPAILDMKWLVF